MSKRMKKYRVVQTTISALLLFGILADVWIYPHIGQKLFLGYLSVVVTVGGYLLYLASMYKHEAGHQKLVKPHPLSWVMFGFLTLTGWMVQEAGGAQAGSWCLGVTGVFCFVIAAATYLKYRSEWRFTRDEWGAVAGGAILFSFYLVTKSAALSATLATGAGFVLYWPTVKKGWARPYSDNPVNFTFNSVKCIPALLALSVVTYSTSVYLWMLLVMNGLVALMLWARRGYLERPVEVAA